MASMLCDYSRVGAKVKAIYSVLLLIKSIITHQDLEVTYFDYHIKWFPALSSSMLLQGAVQPYDMSLG